MAKLSTKPALTFLFLFLPVYLLLNPPVLAQRGPEIIEPKRRDGSAVGTARSAPPTKGVLSVLFDYEVEGKVRIESVTGKLIEEAITDATGQAQFVLKRGQVYKVKGSVQGYQVDERNSKVLKASDTVLLKLTARTASLNLIDLPAGAQVFIDETPQPRAVIDSSGSAIISDLTPGVHKLKVKHSDYREVTAELPNLKAGATMIYPVIMDKVATLTFQTLPGARVLIDGALRGTAQSDGKVVIDYVIDQVGEHPIAVELLGYQPWSRKELLAPGPRTIEVKLDPVVTSAGFSDSFDDLMNWKPPSGQSWELAGEPGKTKLRIKGQEPGTLKDKIYRDVQEAVFTVWLDDGKGATWVVRADKEGRNYYLFHLAGPKSTNYIAKRFYTFLVKDGGTPERVDTPTPVTTELNQGISYTITVEISGFTVRHWITSNETGQKDPLGSWTDTTPTKDKFLYGTFGFRSLTGEVFTVDDFSLEPANNQ